MNGLFYAGLLQFIFMSPALKYMASLIAPAPTSKAEPGVAHFSCTALIPHQSKRADTLHPAYGTSSKSNSTGHGFPFSAPFVTWWICIFFMHFNLFEQQSTNLHNP